MSGFRRTVPYLAAGSIVAAAGLTAALASGAAATSGGGAAQAAAQASASAQADQASAAARAAASASAASASASAAAVASASASASAKAAASASANAAAAARAKLNTVAGRNEALRAEGVPCDEHAIACVSLSKQEAWLLHDGKVVYGPVHVATGRVGHRTPAGDFHVWYKVVDGWSTTYDAPMPYSVFFYEGDAFHEDPITVRSHGCVHLSLKNAEYFYRFLQYGDLVEVRD